MRDPIQARLMHREGTAGRAAGLTLIELMVTLVIMAVLAAVAYPNMQNLMRHNRVVALSNSLQADLQYARGQAAATRAYVSICPVANPGDQTCASGSGSYDNGWLVYTSLTANAAYDGSASNLQRVEQAATNASLRSSISNVLTYNARGMLLSGNDQEASSDVLFYVCSKSTSSDTIGTSTAGIPGIAMNAAGAGRISSTPLAADSSCTPSPPGT